MATYGRWNRSVVDEQGTVVPQALIEVRNELGGGIANIFQDRAGLTPLTNPFAADGDGFAFFHAPGGSYKITATDPDDATQIREWRYEPVGNAQEKDVQDLASLSWEGQWQTATSYIVMDAVKHNGASYICITSHTSGASTEPGVGVDWEDDWDVIAERGADVGSGQAAGALQILKGRRGAAWDFRGRGYSVNDPGGVGSASGALENFLTVTRSSGAWYVGRDGLLAFDSNSDTLRYYHDPITKEPLGARIEISTTNLCLRSNELNNASWTKVNATVTADQGVAPDGTTTLDRITCTTASFPRAVHGNISITSGQRYTVSFFLRGGTAGFAQGTFNNGGNTQLVRYFINLTTGATALSAIVGSMTATIRSEDWGGGLWRLIVMFAPTTTENYSFFIGPSNTISSTSGDVGEYIDAGFVQFENQAGATSYVGHTSGSTVTRNSETLSVAYSSLPASVGGNEATLFFDVDIPNYLDITNNKILGALEVDANNRMTISINSSAVLDGQIVSGGTDGITAFAPTVASRSLRAALACRLNDSEISVNGSTNSSIDTSVAAPVGTYGTLYFGRYSANLHTLNLKAAAYFPRRLPAAEMNALTTASIY